MKLEETGLGKEGFTESAIEARHREGKSRREGRQEEIKSRPSLASHRACIVLLFAPRKGEIKSVEIEDLKGFDK